MNKMIPEIKEKWVAALESGEYQQAQQGLKITNLETGSESFCCLGVLCDIYSKETGNKWGESLQMIRNEPVGKSYLLGENNYLPKEVRDWAGLTEINPAVLEHSLDFTYTNGEYERTVAYMNDQGKTFEEIAEKIKEKL